MSHQGGLARTLSVEGVQATRPLFTQPEGRTATDSVPVGRGGPGNSPPLYAAGGAHCNRPLPRDNARQSHAQWSSREATMAHGSPGRKGREGKKAGEGRKPTQGVSRGGVMGWKRVPYFAEKEGQFRP